MSIIKLFRISLTTICLSVRSLFHLLVLKIFFIGIIPPLTKCCPTICFRRRLSMVEFYVTLLHLLSDLLRHSPLLCLLHLFLSSKSDAFYSSTSITTTGLFCSISVPNKSVVSFYPQTDQITATSQSSFLLVYTVSRLATFYKCFVPIQGPSWSCNLFSFVTPIIYLFQFGSS